MMKKFFIIVIKNNQRNESFYSKLKKKVDVKFVNNYQEIEQLVFLFKDNISQIIFDYDTINDNFYTLLKKVNSLVGEKKNYIISYDFSNDIQNELLKNGAYIILYNPFDCEKIIERIISVNNDCEKDRKKLVKNELMYDSLTGVYNKEYFYYTAKKYLVNEDLCLICLDIQNFTRVNNIFGRNIADSILVKLGAILRQKCEEKGFPYGRIENDIFVCICPKEEIKEKSFDLNYYWVDNVKYEFKLSVGIYIIDDLSIPLDKMCQYALIAAKSCKNKKENYSYFDVVLLNKIKLEEIIMSDFNRAIEEEEFVVFYQPVLSLNSHKVVSCEALVRWNHPSKGMIMPSDFIPLYEENKKIYELDLYILNRVCQDLKEYRDNHSKNTIPISVNFSRLDFYNDGLIEAINAILEKYSIPHECIRIEITESVFQNDEKRIIEVAENLRNQGYKILMDDFGTGYSSLKSLETIPVDIIKLDMRFMKYLNENNKTSIIVSSILRMCKLLELKVIAEGVENQRQSEFLKSLGCEYAQGFLFSKPLCLNDFHDFIKNKRVTEEEIVFVNKQEIDIRAIWDTENKFNSLFNNMITTMGFYEYDKEEGLNLIRVNNAYYELVGGTMPNKYDDPNVPFREVYLKNREKFDELIFNAKHKKSVSNITIDRKKYDGSSYLASIHAKYIGSINDRDEFIFTIKDVTDEYSHKEKMIELDKIFPFENWAMCKMLYKNNEIFLYKKDYTKVMFTDVLVGENFKSVIKGNDLVKLKNKIDEFLKKRKKIRFSIETISKSNEKRELSIIIYEAFYNESGYVISTMIEEIIK